MKTSAATNDPYQAIPALYDLEHDQFEDDIGCLMNFVISTGDPVLELGAGTGRLVVPIAEAGYRVTGIDTSSSMLAVARERVQSAGVEDRVTLLELGMEQSAMAPGGPFGVVIASLNSLLHLASAAAQRTALAQAFTALDPRGQLLIDVMNPTPAALVALDHQYVLEGTWHREDGSLVQKFSSRRVSAAEQQIETDIWYDITSADGSLRRIPTSFSMRYLHRSELELMLELAGFASWECYGSYELDPFDDQSDRLIVAAEAS
jgi:2-polyprenyl-3-methyl-5-hydroxy-6-metoxy-1,4-benzoquinol methylase